MHTAQFSNDYARNLLLLRAMNRRRRRALRLARLACLVAALCIGTVPTEFVRAQQAPARDAGRSQAVLQPGDKVQLRIWREPDLSGEFVVAEDGIVVFPKIGRVQVDRLSATAPARRPTGAHVAQRLYLDVI
jgi:hypothetical protein